MRWFNQNSCRFTFCHSTNPVHMDGWNCWSGSHVDSWSVQTVLTMQHVSSSCGQYYKIIILCNHINCATQKQILCTNIVDKLWNDINVVSISLIKSANLALADFSQLKNKSWVRNWLVLSELYCNIKIPNLSCKRKDGTDGFKTQGLKCPIRKKCLFSVCELQKL